jgi:hypothetical protein
VRGLIVVTCAVAALATTSCGSESPGKSTCEQAADVVDACGLDGASLRRTACAGDNLTYSRCAVDNQAKVCAGLANPTNLGNAFNACVANLGQT